MKDKKKLIWGVIIILIIMAAVLFFWPKSCGSGGFVPPTAIVRDCNCLGFKYNPGCCDRGDLCSGIPIKYHCYTHINGTKAEVPC